MNDTDDIVSALTSAKLGIEAALAAMGGDTPNRVVALAHCDSALTNTEFAVGRLMPDDDDGEGDE